MAWGLRLSDFRLSNFRLSSFPSEDKKRDLTPNLDKPVPSYIENLNLGINVAGGNMYVFIPENTKIPIKVEKFIITRNDYQSRLTMKVYEGENPLVSENILLGEVKLDGLPPAQKGVFKLKVCFDIDVNGTLKVSTVHMIFPELKNEITITSDLRRSAKAMDAKIRLKRYANNIKQTLSDARFKGKLEAVENKKIMKKIMKMADEAIKWSKMNPSAAFYEYKGKQKELEVLWNPVINKLQQPLKIKNKVHQDAGEPSSGPAKAGSKLDEVD